MHSANSSDTTVTPAAGAPLRVLLVGDASNCHNALAVGLRKLGHKVVVASDGTRWMNTPRDIDLSRRFRGKTGGLELWLRLMWQRKAMTGFDIVSVASQDFIQLRPVRQLALFDFLRRNNRRIFYTALATDSNYVDYALSHSCHLRYTEFLFGGKPTPYMLHQGDLAREWLSEPLKNASDHILDSVDGAVSVLYEYHRALLHKLPESKVAYGGIPIDVDALKPVDRPAKLGKIRFLLGRHRNRVLEKGGEILEAAARSVAGRFPDRCELMVVENLPYNEYLDRLRSAHVLLDQLYSHTPATNALTAMAFGLAVVSGAEPEYYDFIGESSNRPIINGIPDYETLTDTLTHLVTHPEEIILRGRMGRDFVRRHNADTTVAHRFASFWQSKLQV